jgi:hypothetical protein
VGQAWHELAVAGHQLALALWSAVGSRISVGQSQAVTTAFEEAEELRAFAIQQMRSDPAFADDLFAAADRHEDSARI